MFSLSPAESEITQILQQFPYYVSLPAAGRAVFEERLHHFISDKHFEGRQGLKLSPEMVVLISASAIQLTFGLKEYMMSRFSNIYIYPEPYYSNYDQLYHKGEANTRGLLVLSWPDFKEGYEDPTDKVNLGLHEWAHALMVGYMFAEGIDELFADYYPRWRAEAQIIMPQVLYGYQDVFREYGAVNMAEFFSVSIEVFFENPQLYHDRAPQLFYHTCILLNQFPLGKENSRERNADILLENISRTAERVLELRLEPGEKSKSTNEYFAILIPMGIKFLLLIILIYSKADSALLYTGLCAFIALDVYRLLAKPVIKSNSIYCYNDSIVVLGTDNNEIARFNYEKLVMIEIRQIEEEFAIDFSFPDKGRLVHKEFLFSFSDMGIMRLREFMQDKSTPVRMLKNPDEEVGFLDYI